MYYNNKPLSTKRHWFAAIVVSLLVVGGMGAAAEIIIGGMSQNHASAWSKQQ